MKLKRLWEQLYLLLNLCTSVESSTEIWTQQTSLYQMMSKVWKYSISTSPSWLISKPLMIRDKNNTPRQSKSSLMRFNSYPIIVNHLQNSLFSQKLGLLYIQHLRCNRRWNTRKRNYYLIILVKTLIFGEQELFSIFF